MPTKRQRDNALKKERRKRGRRLTAIQRDTAGEIERLLREADASIAARLAQSTSDFEQATLPALQRSVRQTLAAMQAGGEAALHGGADRAWRAGVEMIDRPVEAGFNLGGPPTLRLEAQLPSVDPRQLAAMKSFLTDKIADITTTVANRVNSELGLTLLGAQTPSETVTAVARHIKGSRSRALTIVRTELGRAFSAASQARFEQAQSILPGLKKQWRRSGKRHSRIAHDLIDGQIRAVDEPFDVGGVELMFPRDPKGPAKETINCGCTSLPWMDSWSVKQPGEQPFTADELAADPGKRLIAPLLDPDGELSGPTIQAPPPQPSTPR